MGHQVGDVCQISLIGTCENQRILNIFHVRVVSSQSAQADHTDNMDLAQYYAGMLMPIGALGGINACMAKNYTLSTIRAQKIFPIRSAFMDAPASLPGTALTDANAINISAVITKRGTKGTRKAQGSLHIGPVPSGGLQLGYLEVQHRTALQLFANEWMKEFTNPLQLIRYRPCIYNRTDNPPWDDILAVSVQDTARAMRRRTVGLGV